MADDSTIRPDEQTLVDGTETPKATEGQIEPDHVVGELTAEHEEYLRAHAVDIDIARSLGVRSLVSRADTADLSDVWINFTNFPAIFFPWTDALGERVEYQVRPDNPTKDSRGRPRKYMWRKGAVPVLWAVRPAPGAEKMIIVEGTKQCLAAASYAPPGVEVFGIAGCRMWQVNGVPIEDLALADGREVVVILDTDAAGNPDVYEAGVGLAQALAMEGATKVTFGRMAGASKAGLDDVLATKAPSRRAAYLARIIDSAKPKPADAKPKPKKKDGAPPADEQRTTIVCNQDRFDVINNLTDALIKRWDGQNLFNHGGVISWLNDTSMQPVDRATFHDVVQRTALTVNENEGANGTTYTFAWPDGGSMSATMSRASAFSALDRISHAPFARPDGSIVTEPGYDEATKTVLIPDPELEGLTVPEDPTPQEITAARELLLKEWLGDFPFETQADWANALALIVTPAIRGMVPKVPLAVVDGLQMGVGKNLVADCLLTVYTGHPSRPMNFVDEAEELRKQITSAFRTGQEFFVFDEAHTLQGAALAQALTASTWQDRILGVSTMAEFPNRVTWISLGNQVQVRGDLTRRVYRISLRPNYANPQDRDASSFRHPGTSGLDLGSWTRKNRRELMTAILTLVRAWFAAGSPYPKRGVSFGSFEAWERIAGGIVETAGLPGFLDNLKVWRSESDFETQYWMGHITWLREKFGDRPFRTGDVKREAMADLQAYLAPPRLDDPADKGYGKALGEAYSRLRNRRYEGMWIERVGWSHGHVSLWRVFAGGDAPTEGNPGLEPTPGPLPLDPEPDAPTDTTEPEEIPVAEEDPAPDTEAMTSKTDTGEDMPVAGIVHGQAPGMLGEMERALAEQGLNTDGEPFVVALDLETGDKDDLHRHGPGFVRLAGWTVDDGPVQITSNNPAVSAAAALSGAGVITGHNIMAFDLPALVREGFATMPQIHKAACDGRLFDAILAARYLDPPMARDKGVDVTRKYDLGALAQKYNAGEKLTDVSAALAKKYGGWGNIPIDAESEDGRAFRRYLEHDVEASRGLYRELNHLILTEHGDGAREYLVREHRVAAIAAQISYNGFRVDLPELDRRITEINQRKASAMELLAGKYGIPTHDAKGKAYASPLSSKAGKVALEAALRAAGATSIWKTDKTREIQVSTDHMVHLGQEYHHLPGVVEIVKAVYRIVSARTVYETISHNLIGDRVHPKVAFEQATGRWSVTKPGMTVMGKRGGRHIERAVFLADPGDVVLAVDLSQVDMRALAGLSQDQAYIEMLRHEDPHAEIAEALFGDRKLREIAKPIGHGWNYGRSPKTIATMEEIDPALAWRFDREMREKFPRLVEWQGEVRAIAESGQLLDNGFGRLMRPDPMRAHTQGPALMGQGAARDIMMAGLLNVVDRYPEVLPMLRTQVHDEIVLSVPADQAVDVGRAVVECLSFEWRNVPITADTSPVGVDWSKCYEKG